MPLYDCMLLLKPHIMRENVMELVHKVGKHVYTRNGVITDLKSFGTVQLGYGIKKLDGRYYQGQMMQMTMMTPPSFNKELHYLNKDDCLLRWLLVKHRDFKPNMELFAKSDGPWNPWSSSIGVSSYFGGGNKNEQDSDEDSDDDDDFKI